MGKTLTLVQANARAKALRDFSNRQFTLADLLQIFGHAFKAKFMEAPTRHQIPGKHHVLRGNCCRYEHPPGTKLVRRFIRQARGEQVEYRRIYARLTSHQLGQGK